MVKGPFPRYLIRRYRDTFVGARDADTHTLSLLARAARAMWLEPKLPAYVTGVGPFGQRPIQPPPNVPVFGERITIQHRSH